MANPSVNIDDPASMKIIETATAAGVGTLRCTRVANRDAEIKLLDAQIPARSACHPQPIKMRLDAIVEFGEGFEIALRPRIQRVALGRVAAEQHLPPALAVISTPLLSSPVGASTPSWL